MTLRIISVIVALTLFCYLLFASFIFAGSRQDQDCTELIVVVKDSLDKHFVTQADIISLLKSIDMYPVGKPVSQFDTNRMEEELLKNEMIAKVEAYKTPSGAIKLEVVQKMPVLRVMSNGGDYYVDHSGSSMPVSRRYAAYVPVATGYIEKELALTGLYKFALFLQKNDFWNNQIEQIYVHPNKEVTLIPRVGSHRILLGTLDDFNEKLDNLQLFYEQAIPKVGWEKYNQINLKYKEQIVCTKN